MPDTEIVYLSARVPMRLRNAFKSLAARRGLKVQELLRVVVEDYVDSEDARPPTAGMVVHCLRRHRDEFKQAGIRHLALFGSVARGDAYAASDIDLVAEFEGDRTPSLITIGKLADRIRDLLGGYHDIDLVPAGKMRQPVSSAAEDEAIRIF